MNTTISVRIEAYEIDLASILPIYLQNTVYLHILELDLYKKPLYIILKIDLLFIIKGRFKG